MPEYRTAKAICLACDEPASILALEWPPKVFVCPTCNTALVLISYEDDLAAYKLAKLPPK